MDAKDDSPGGLLLARRLMRRLVDVERLEGGVQGRTGRDIMKGATRKGDIADEFM